MIIKEFWHINQFESEIRENEYEDNVIDKNKVVIKSEYSLISTGTERTVAKGLVPDELKQIMKVPFMEGNFDFPIKYGYSLVGTVLQGNKSLVGKTVHLMHPHQDFSIVPDLQLTIVPESIPPQRAVLASNMETAVNVIWDSGISVGDNVIICGFGIIGALIALIASQIPSVKVYIHEADQNRKQVAASMGFSIFETMGGDIEAFDVAINTTSSGEALQLCIDNTLPQSKIIEVSWYGVDPVNILLGSAFHVGQKQIISSQVSTIPYNKQTHFNFKRRKQVVFNLLTNTIFDQLPIEIINFDQLPKLFNNLRNSDYNQFATIVKY